MRCAPRLAEASCAPPYRSAAADLSAASSPRRPMGFSPPVRSTSRSVGSGASSNPHSQPEHKDRCTRLSDVISLVVLDHPLRGLPEAAGVPRVERVRRNPAGCFGRKVAWQQLRLVAVLEVTAADALELVRGGDEH